MRPDGDPRTWPRITMVMPVFNAGSYVDEALSSIVMQDYPNLELFVVDGGSTDSTLDIIRKYESHLDWWCSEPDEGMYDALNKGFRRATGEIMGWLSGTDLLHPGALVGVAKIMMAHPEVEWLTGRPTGLTPDGKLVIRKELPRWSRFRYLAGPSRSIQQESTFWRRSLWEKAGGQVDGSLRYCGDCELWLRFFRHVPLYSASLLIGCYRDHGDALGNVEREECQRIREALIERELRTIVGARFIRSLRRAETAAMRRRILASLWRRGVQRPLVRFPGPDTPPVVGVGT